MSSMLGMVLPIITASDDASYMRLKRLTMGVDHPVKVFNPHLHTPGIAGGIHDIPVGYFEDRHLGSPGSSFVVGALRILKHVRNREI